MPEEIGEMCLRDYEEQPLRDLIKQGKAAHRRKGRRQMTRITAAQNIKAPETLAGLPVESVADLPPGHIVVWAEPAHEEPAGEVQQASLGI